MGETQVCDYAMGDKSGSVEAKPGQTYRVVDGDGNVIAEINIPDVKVQNLRFHYSIMVRGEMLLDEMSGDEVKVAVSSTIYAKTAMKAAIEPAEKIQG